MSMSFSFSLGRISYEYKKDTMLLFITTINLSQLCTYLNFKPFTLRVIVLFRNKSYIIYMESKHAIYITHVDVLTII